MTEGSDDDDGETFATVETPNGAKVSVRDDDANGEDLVETALSALSRASKMEPGYDGVEHK